MRKQKINRMAGFAIILIAVGSIFLASCQDIVRRLPDDEKYFPPAHKSPSLEQEEEVDPNGARILKSEDVTKGSNTKSEADFKVSNGHLIISGGGGHGVFWLDESITYFECASISDSKTSNNFRFFVAGNGDAGHGLVAGDSTDYTYCTASNWDKTSGITGYEKATGDLANKKFVIQINEDKTVTATLGEHTIYNGDPTNLKTGTTYTTPRIGFAPSWSGSATIVFTNCKVK